MDIQFFFGEYISLYNDSNQLFAIDIKTVPFLIFIAAIITLRYGFKRYRSYKIRKRLEKEQSAIEAMLGVVQPRVNSATTKRPGYEATTVWLDEAAAWHEKDKKDRSCGCD